MQKILLVEDDVDLSTLICSYLAHCHFDVALVSRGDEVLEQIKNSPPDLVVLDLMLPGMDGFQVCKALRSKREDLPILMLTARDDSHDQVLGLELGADDYVIKPCEPRVLVARIRALLRRSQQGPVQEGTSTVFRVGALELDLAERVVTWRGEEVALSSSEFDLLGVLVENVGVVQSRDDIVRQLRGVDFNGVDRTVDVTVSKLRRRFEDVPADPRKIKTVWGRGYILTKAEWEV